MLLVVFSEISVELLLSFRRLARLILTVNLNLHRIPLQTLRTHRTHQAGRHLVAMTSLFRRRTCRTTQAAWNPNENVGLKLGKSVRMPPRNCQQTIFSNKIRQDMIE